MEKYHTIYFYDLYNLTQNETVDQIFFNSFNEGNNGYIFHIKSKKYNFDIIELDEDHCFGRLSKYEDYKESMTTIITKKDEQPLNPSDYIFEKFTFFFIKFNRDKSKPSKLSVINNIGLKIEQCFTEYFLLKYKMLPILIKPTITPNIKDQIKNLKKVSKIDCTLSDTTLNNNQTSFLRIFDCSCYFKKLSAKITFREKNPEKLQDIIDNANVTYSHLKITGWSETGKEYINVLERIFTKSSKIEMRYISLQNFEPIKKALNDFSAL
jgi:hypothetical protein